MSIKGTFERGNRRYNNAVVRVRNAWGGAQDGVWTCVVDVFNGAAFAQHPNPVPLESFTTTVNYLPQQDPVAQAYGQIKRTIPFDSYEDV